MAGKQILIFGKIVYVRSSSEAALCFLPCSLGIVDNLYVVITTVILVFSVFNNKHSAQLDLTIWILEQLLFKYVSWSITYILEHRTRSIGRSNLAQNSSFDSLSLCSSSRLEVLTAILVHEHFLESTTEGFVLRALSIT